MSERLIVVLLAAVCANLVRLLGVKQVFQASDARFMAVTC